MIPSILATAWWLNRICFIVITHFIITNQAHIVRLMNIVLMVFVISFFHTIMTFAKWLKLIDKFKLAILLDATWKMKWFFAGFFTTINVCTILIAYITFLWRLNIIHVKVNNGYNYNHYRGDSQKFNCRNYLLFCSFSFNFDIFWHET